MVTPIDAAFVMAGLTGLGVAWFKSKAVSPVRKAEEPEVSRGEVGLWMLALVAAAVGPNILVVALTPGMPEMHLLGRYVLLPSLLVLFLVLSLAGYFRFRRLVHLIVLGIWIGASTTAVLDVIRLTGFSLGWLPGDMPRMFGVLLLDRMALGPSIVSDIGGGAVPLLGWGVLRDDIYPADWEIALVGPRDLGNPD